MRFHLYVVIFCCRLAPRHATCPWLNLLAPHHHKAPVSHWPVPKGRLLLLVCVVFSFFDDTSEDRRQKIAHRQIRYSHHYLYHHQIPSLYLADISFAPMKILNQALLCWISYTSVKLVWKMATTNKDTKTWNVCHLAPQVNVLLVNHHAIVLWTVSGSFSFNGGSPCA